MAAEAGGEILAGVEAVGKGDFGDGEFGLVAQLLGGTFDAALVEVFHGAAVHEIATML